MAAACTAGIFCVKTAIITAKVKNEELLLPFRNYFSDSRIGSAKRFAEIYNGKKLQIVTVKLCNLLKKNILKCGRGCSIGKNIYKNYPKISERFVLSYKKD